MADSSNVQPIEPSQGGIIQMTEKQFTTLIRSVVAEEFSRAMVDIRKGEAAMVKQLDTLNNTILGLKNANSALAKRLEEGRTGGKGPSIVYINNTEPPKDLFGNNNNVPVEELK